jgi:hypothetical protein
MVMRMRKMILFLLFLSPASAFACFQTEPKLYNIQIENDSIKARFTYNQKPIADAPVELRSPKGEPLSSTRTDKYGWFVFSNVKPGQYKVALLRPSGESFHFTLIPPKQSKTVLHANFYGDWCRQVSIIPDPLPWAPSPATK